ncbi:hypothetical protein [Acinetobacter sp. YH12070]|uniref:hypothetical protein n=1 Tax=Acinetobacter sp. YH12070 TaxID=2601066 RepID=UPI0015D18CA6|nr:hypothetical protein [Acinetobacter sp. YH12070]
MSHVFRSISLCLSLSFSMSLQAEQTINRHEFPLYHAPIKVQSQPEFDYINQALWTAFRFYHEQQADSYTARLKLSCQQSGMAYTYQDFIKANQKFASADDQDFIVTQNLITLNENLHHNQCSKYLGPHLELEKTESSEAAKPTN